jgi:membrane protein YqaA with SNARE-associated domain
MADLIALLEEVFTNPVLFFPLLFIYSVLVAIILPIPIEIALIWPLLKGDLLFYAGATLTMAIGKSVGSWGIFFLGTKVEDNIRRWSERYEIARRFVDVMISFVRKTRYIGLLILLSIPLMMDTVPIYIYSLFNKEGEILHLKLFLAVNFIAAIIRSIIVAMVFVALGWVLA